MVETISPGARVAAAMPPNAPPARRESLYPDGSAVPDIVAYHHRPEDLGDDSDQTVPDETDSGFFGADGLTFGDLLDIINPLQHIPIISTLYRALTGDEISPGARIAGGALFGGPIGLGIAIVNAAIEASTGEDIGDTIMTALTGDAPATAARPAATTQLADTAVMATDSNPALLAARTMPISLLPPAAVTAGPPIRRRRVVCRVWPALRRHGWIAVRGGLRGRQRPGRRRSSRALGRADGRPGSGSRQGAAWPGRPSVAVAAHRYAPVGQTGGARREDGHPTRAAEPGRRRRRSRRAKRRPGGALPTRAHHRDLPNHAKRAGPVSRHEESGVGRSAQGIETKRWILASRRRVLLPSAAGA